MKKPIIVNEDGRSKTAITERDENNVAVGLMNHLIETNRDVVNVYKTAAEKMEDKTNVEIINGYINQHEKFVAELSNLVASHSGDPETTGSVSGYVKKVWVTLKSAVTDGDGSLLSEVVQDAETALGAYSEAMAADAPDDVRDILRKHMSQARLAHEKLSALSAAFNS